MCFLFSKVDLNKLWHDVQNEETLICAKFGKDLFNISKVVGRKKVPQFFPLTVYMFKLTPTLAVRYMLYIPVLYGICFSPSEIA